MSGDTQLKLLYQCIAAAHESLHLIHRGPNDIFAVPSPIS